MCYVFKTFVDFKQKIFKNCLTNYVTSVCTNVLKTWLYTIFDTAIQCRAKSEVVTAYCPIQQLLHFGFAWYLRFPAAAAAADSTAAEDTAADDGTQDDEEEEDATHYDQDCQHI